ncbi:hypothetical protein GCM10022378_04560 [Salinicoccus jeotgali]|uniref:Uncharacterized protein n=1 Tax=Salinicoccus jeotgali TaxID=381634 RepID=A0ABP7EFF1_9STAP
MKKIEVYTKKELTSAKDEGYEEIIVRGKLAKKLKKGSKITKLSKVKLGILIAALGVSILPIPGGSAGIAGVTRLALLNTAKTATTATTANTATMFTGLEIAAMITASTIGISTIIALFKDYEEISFDKDKLILRKKQKEI